MPGSNKDDPKKFPKNRIEYFGYGNWCPDRQGHTGANVIMNYAIDFVVIISLLA